METWWKLYSFPSMACVKNLYIVFFIHSFIHSLNFRFVLSSTFLSWFSMAVWSTETNPSSTNWRKYPTWWPNTRKSTMTSESNLFRVPKNYISTRTTWPSPTRRPRTVAWTERPSKKYPATCRTWSVFCAPAPPTTGPVPITGTCARGRTKCWTNCSRSCWRRWKRTAIWAARCPGSHFATRKRPPITKWSTASWRWTVARCDPWWRMWMRTATSRWRFRSVARSGSTCPSWTAPLRATSMGTDFRSPRRTFASASWTTKSKMCSGFSKWSTPKRWWTTDSRLLTTTTPSTWCWKMYPKWSTTDFWSFWNRFWGRIFFEGQRWANYRVVPADMDLAAFEDL